MRPATTFASQYTAYRVWVHSYTTGAGTWTDWRYMNAPETHANFVPLPRSSGTNNYAMYMEYSWWNGRTWSGTGEWITTYTQQTLYGGYFYQNYCTA